LGTNATGLDDTSPHSSASVNIACTNIMDMRIASGPLPAVCISTRHIEILRGVISSSGRSPRRDSTARRHTPS
jgi:hypothetical protein